MVIGIRSIVKGEIKGVETDPAVTLGLILNFVFQVRDTFVNTSSICLMPDRTVKNRDKPGE